MNWKAISKVLIQPLWLGVGAIATLIVGIVTFWWPESNNTIPGFSNRAIER